MSFRVHLPFGNQIALLSTRNSSNSEGEPDFLADMSILLVLLQSFIHIAYIILFGVSFAALGVSAKCDDGRKGCKSSERSNQCLESRQLGDICRITPKPCSPQRSHASHDAFTIFIQNAKNHEVPYHHKVLYRKVYSLVF